MADTGGWRLTLPAAVALLLAGSLAQAAASAAWSYLTRAPDAAAAAEPERPRHLPRRVSHADGLRIQQMVEGLGPEYAQVTKGASMEEAVHLRALHGDDSFPGRRGPEDIHRVAAATRAQNAARKARTPREVILELQRGNGRFWMGLAERPEMNAMERRALIIAQAPSVCILGCSDSRVPVEIVFDQGLGDIFVVRLAGNVLDAASHGSVEYAVSHLEVKVVLVLGHEGCGAVRGAMAMGEAELAAEPRHLQSLLRAIRASLAVDRIRKISAFRLSTEQTTS